MFTEELRTRPEKVERFVNGWGDVVLGDGQDDESYQMFRSLGTLQEKLSFMKEFLGKSEDELKDSFYEWLNN